jgi:hypothetical protein
MDELKLSSTYYDDKKYYYAISDFMKKPIVKAEILPLENFYNAIFTTRAHISDEYNKRIFLRTEPVNKEILEMIKSNDQETIQLGVRLLLSSKKPNDHSTYNYLYEVLTILTNMYSQYANNTVLKAIWIWIYLCDIVNFEKIYLLNIANKYTVCNMDLERIDFK